MSNGKEVLEKLVIDKTEMKKNLDQLVEKSLKVFRIEKEGGKIIFQNFGALSDSDKICTFLIGKYFATELEIIKDNTLSVSQIAKEIGRPITALSGPIKELVNRGFVEWLPTRKYRIVYHRMDEILDYLVNTTIRKKQKE
jgi:DNA-binding MarR family transcriptional regulator